MSFIQREIDRIAQALKEGPDAVDYARLYSAQQALSWASDPDGFASPMKEIRGTREGSEDYSGVPRQLPS